MARPIDWSPLAETDPVPGNPAEVSELARRYRDTAEAISTAASKLRSIASTDGWVGKAAIEFRDQALSVADSIERAHERYDETATALQDYQPDHDEAQRLSAQALTAAKDAEAEERRAQSLYDSEAAKPEPDEALLTTYDQRIRQAQSDLTQARRQLADAVDTYTTAAETAAARIHEVSQNDGLKTTWRDRLASALKVIANVAGIIAAVAGILSLAVGWIPVIGQALAAALGAIALIAGVISLVANIGLLIMGEGSWSAVILDAIGVLTFGIGRLFSSAAKFSAKSAQLGSAWARALPKAGQGRVAAWLNGTMPLKGRPIPLTGGATRSILSGSFGGLLDDLRGIRAVWGGRSAASIPRVAPDGFAAQIHRFFGNHDLAAELSALRAMRSTNFRPITFADRALNQSVISAVATTTGGLLDIYQFDSNVTGVLG